MVFNHLIYRMSECTFSFPRDICASAPTGSGKTLAYALPIIQVLMNRVIIFLRAVIILPTRELASQVFKVFCRIAQNTTLKIALASGQNNLEFEQEIIIGNRSRKRSRHESYSSAEIHAREPSADYDVFGKSLVDILVCTPGRLLEHLENTEGFTLKNLRFLVLY